MPNLDSRLLDTVPIKRLARLAITSSGAETLPLRTVTSNMSVTNGMVMPTSIGGCIGSILSTAFKLGTLVRDITNAPTHIHRICAKAESCRAMVLSLRILLAQMGREGGSDQVGLELIYVSNLADTLLGCQETLGLIGKELEDLMHENMKIGRDERARWIWREKEIEELLRQLDEYKLELILNLNILNCHQGQEIRKQNAEILSSIHSSQRSASIEPPTPVRLPTSSKKRQQSLSLSTLSEHEEVEIFEELQNNPEQDTNSPSTSRLSTEANTPSINPPFADGEYTSSSTSYSTTVSGLTLTKAPSFQEILFASKVYQRRSSERKEKVFPSDITLSELHHSSTSILSYSLRRSSSFSASLAIFTAGAPLSILSKTPSQKRVDAAFAEAVKKQNLKAMATLLEYGADVNFLDEKERKNLVHIACSQKLPTLAPNSLVVTFLLDHGADVNALTGHSGITPLYIAIRGGNIELAQLLLAYGADVNIQDMYGETLCHGVASGWPGSDCAVLQLLLDHGGAIDAVNYHGQTALFNAIIHEKSAIVKLLIEAGANVNIQDKKGQTPLYMAHKSASYTSLLLDHDANIHTLDHNGDTALSYAVSCGVTPEVLKLLLDSGADSRNKNKQGKTALHLAFERYNRNEIIKMLLEHNADRYVDVVDDNGETPLMKVISAGALESVRLLLKAGADLRKRNTHGKTPLHLAASLGFWHRGELKNKFLKITQLLLEHGAHIDAEDENGDTPLFSAVRGGWGKQTELLLKAGANAMKANKEGMTPLHFAQLHHNSSHLVHILQEYGV